MSCIDIEAAHSGDENGDDGYHTDTNLDEYEPDGLQPNKDLGPSDYETGEEPEDNETQLHRRAEAELELNQQREKAKAIRKEKKRLIREKQLQEEAEELLRDKKKHIKRLKKLPKDEEDDDADIELQQHTHKLLPADSGNETEELDGSAAPLGYADESKIKKQSTMFSFMSKKPAATQRPEWMVGDKVVASVNNTKQTHYWKIEKLGELVPHDATTWKPESYRECTPSHYTTASRKEGDETIYEIFLLGRDGFAHHVTRDGADVIERQTSNQGADRRKEARLRNNLQPHHTLGTMELFMPVTYYNRIRNDKESVSRSAPAATPHNIIQDTCSWALEFLVLKHGLSSQKLEAVFDTHLAVWQEWATEAKGDHAKIWSKMRAAHGVETAKLLLFMLPFVSEASTRQLKTLMKQLRNQEKQQQQLPAATGSTPP